MNLFQIALKNMRQRGLASILTMLSVALGIALMVAVLLLHGILGQQFSQSGSGYNLIIGPEGSPTQLVLSTVYRIENPIQNMPWRYFQKWQSDHRVELAIPLAFGDATEQGDFPVLGTTPQYFKIPVARNPQPQPYRVRGDFLRGSWDAVIGSQVAKRNGWDIGSQFKLVHGGQRGEDAHVHDEMFTVVGVLQATGTPNDRSVFVHIDGFHMLAGHENPIKEAIGRESQFFHESVEELTKRYEKELIAEANEQVFLAQNKGKPHKAHMPPDVAKEVTSILIVTKGEAGDELTRSSLALNIQTDLGEDTAAQAVPPVGVMDRIMKQFVTPVQVTFLGLTGMILAVSAIGIFVSIYNSMTERRREIAIMRALGAQRQTVSLMILCETLLLCLGGGVLGLLLAHGIMIVAGPAIEDATGLLVNRWAVSPWELIILPVTLVVAALSGLIPSVTAYRTDVAETLAN